MSSITYPYHLPFFLSKQLENDISEKPLDLSASTLKKRVMQQFNDQVPIEKISQRLETSSLSIHKIIEEEFNCINCMKEAPNAGKAKITGTFHLKPYQPSYNHYNKNLLIEQSYCSINPTPNKGASPKVIEKLKELLRFRRFPQFKEEI